jgi:hypothetical protein
MLKIKAIPICMQNRSPTSARALTHAAVLLFSMIVLGAAEFIPTTPPAATNQAGFITRLPNGEVLVLGSTIKSNLPTAEIYSPTARAWRTGNPSPVTVGFAAFLSDGKLLVGGGSRTYSQDGSITVEPQAATALYDWQSGEWTRIADMNVARNAGTAVLMNDGRLLVAGGFVSDGFGAVPLGDPDVEIYDPRSNKWIARQSMLKKRSGGFGTLLPNGNVLVMSGSGYYGGYQWYGLITAETYNSDTDRWTPAPERPSGIAAFSATKLLDGRILVAGGYTNNVENGRAVYQRDCDLYEPLAQSWTRTGSLEFPRSSPLQLTLLQNGKVLSFPELYDPATGTWTRIAPTNSPINGSFTALLDGSALGVTYSFKFTGSSTLYSSRADLYVDFPAINLLSAVTSDGAFRLSFTNSPGATFTVLTSAELLAPLTNWTTLGLTSEPTAGFFEYLDRAGKKSAQQFYAVKAPP